MNCKKNKRHLLINTFNKLSQSYQNRFSFDELEKTKLLSIMNEWQLIAGVKVLEVGGGTGDLSPFILDKIGKKGELVFLDISPKMIKKAKLKLKNFSNIKFINQNIETFKTQGKFDLIIIFNTWPHFLDKARALENCFKLLNKNGKLIISHNESRNSLRFNHKRKDIENEIAEFPDQKEMFKLLKKAGFKIISLVDHEGSDYYQLIGEKVLV